MNYSPPSRAKQIKTDTQRPQGQVGATTTAILFFFFIRALAFIRTFSSITPAAPAIRRPVPFNAAHLMRNFSDLAPVPSVYTEDNYASTPMDEAEKFRQYAAECRRLAERAAAKDRAALLEIADAWIACAEDADRKATNAEKKSQ